MPGLWLNRCRYTILLGISIFDHCPQKFPAMLKRMIFLPALIAAAALPAGAWSGHHLLSRPALEDLDLWARKDSVEAISLKRFLLETEQALAAFLEQQEAWSRENLPHYKARPDGLAFRATGNEEDVLRRFFPRSADEPGEQGAALPAAGPRPVSRRPARDPACAGEHLGAGR